MPSRRASLPVLMLLLLLAARFAAPLPLSAQTPAPAPAHQHDAAAQPTAKGAQPVEHAAAEHGEAAEHGSEHAVRDTIARLFNFLILVGALAYFLKTPISSYLAGRSAQIRQDLVTAAETRRTATTQLEAIQQQLAALPAELAALKTRGEEDVRAEQLRIAQTAASERERLMAQTRREIEMRLRMARRELTEYAAQLAVGVAQERIERTITRDDQLRLVDRYATQLKEAR